MKSIYRVFLLALISIFVSCEAPKAPAPLVNPYFSMEALSAAESGIDFQNTLNYQPDLNIVEYLYYYNGGGVAVGDINNDGWEDLYFSANQLPDRLYLNQGGMKFQDISESAGLLQEASWSNGVTMEDVNNDGLLDIYVSKNGRFNSLQAHNLLYLNNGDLTFTEVSEQYGLDFSGFSTQAAFLDYDLDGDLDIYLLNHNIHSVRSYGSISKRSEQDSLAGDRFYENQLAENGKFVEVTQQAGIYSSPLGYGLAIRVADINNDGWSDIYIGNDFHENDYIYLNNKNGSFTESSKSLVNHTTRFTMGVDMADMNNDGRLDIFTTDMMPYDAEVFLKSGGEDSDKISQIKDRYGFEAQLARNHLQVNNGNDTFVDLALMTETYATDWSWGVLLADFDNDAKNDIFIPNGIVKRPNDLDYINYLSGINFTAFEQSKQDDLRRQIIAEMPTLKIPNLLFRNEGDLNFSKLSNAFMGTPGYSTGAAYSDLDNDGDLDLIVNNINQPAQIFENKLENKGATQLLLKGNSTHPITNGTKVTLFAEGKKYFSEYQSTKGFQSSSTHLLHFGVPHLSVDSVQVVWPDGKLQRLSQLNAARMEVQRKPEGTQVTQQHSGSSYSLSVLPFKHIENSYFDYEKEQLIPELLSTEGPTLLQADFNGDGIDDLFLGGAKAQPSAILLGSKKGDFKNLYQPAFEIDRNFEDIAVASIDIDRDGDLDLYVGSGGNTVISPDNSYEDRIYVNNGKGLFTRAPISLPQTHTGTVAIADFDNDGIQDYFVGSRSITGAYGLTPRSFIIKNDQGRAMKILIKEQFGMLTDSAWVDLNNDGFLDLVLVGDWMPITVLINQQGKGFENQTANYGLQHTQGLWNTVAFFDFDQNGFLDIIAGNVGENFKWKPNSESPVTLYLDDFDENQQVDPIIFYPFFGSQVPFVSKDKLAQQLPIVKKRFPAYKDFSTVSDITAVVGKAPETILQIKELKELRSMLFLNDGNQFKGVPLPKFAQQSTIEDIAVNPEDGTVYFVGNTKSYVVELGMMQANPGGELRDFDPQRLQFTTTLPLPLPHGTLGREIRRLDNGDLVVATNNDFAYLLKQKPNIK